MYKKLIQTITVCAAMIFPTITYADDQSFKNVVCEFSNALANDDAKGAVQKMNDSFSWNPGVQSKVANSLKVMENYNYDASAAYLVADFGDLSKEVLIAANMTQAGIMYIRLRFEHVKGDLNLINVYFKNDYPDTMAKGAFAQDPVLMDC